MYLSFCLIFVCVYVDNAVANYWTTSKALMLAGNIWGKRVDSDQIIICFQSLN